MNLVDPDNPESLKPLIDGGTEGPYLCFPIKLDVTVFPKVLRGRRVSSCPQ